ncbi:AraC family transcriptional regulator [Hymenobacter sediminis]|uniref:helix-turn-helix domain-containing protein n=1 Tax=Hymenobacter sediminis TaxID=2218621 RepID=UPI000DA66C64|nr:AraC family transcriptional regulator [Hymenobacter sediminis]RPD49593.1 AraC family transcriptional regulator [Hymenobacter sediminis]
MNDKQLNPFVDVLASCHGDRRYRGEVAEEDCLLIGVLAGELRVVQAHHIHTCEAGDALLLPRRQPATLVKLPKAGMSFQAVILKLPTALVRDYYAHQPPHPLLPAAAEPLVFAASPLLQSVFASLLPYLELQHPLPTNLLTGKLTEVVEVLRSLNPHTDAVLADHPALGKLDLVAFMETNFRFNMPLAKFSYLTGRSLTSFKRDFRQAFHSSPQRWLTQKRLELAHYLLQEKGRKPVDLYLEVGFENLAHFSTAFKKQFGYPPRAAALRPAAPQPVAA